MKINLDLKFFIPSVIMFILAYMTVTYKIDQYIHFAGEMNAFGFFIMSSLMGIMLLIGSVSKSK
jgi:hypothetical protein